ncbi:MAG: NAD(P)-dependent dehydrogenase (short-subunit alcohol dehydrogenase family) [Halioglobus sp.]
MRAVFVQGQIENNLRELVMQDFADKTAVVTGAASGIGLALARIFAEQKMNVVLADIEEDKLLGAVSAIEALGVAAIGVVTDVGSSNSVAQLCKTAVDTFGSVQILCNNAGVWTGGLLWEQTEEDFEWLMKVNQWGIIHGIRHFVPQMLLQGDDCHVVNTASMAGLCTLPFSGIYHMTKHAALSLSECLFHDLAMTGPQIKVSCLCPELIDTSIASSGRNRPAGLSKENVTEMQQMAEQAITDATRDSLPPRVMAERVLQGIKNEQFYLCPPVSDPWNYPAESRLNDIRDRRNPTFAPPEI